MLLGSRPCPRLGSQTERPGRCRVDGSFPNEVLSEHETPHSPSPAVASNGVVVFAPTERGSCPLEDKHGPNEAGLSEPRRILARLVSLATSLAKTKQPKANPALAGIIIGRCVESLLCAAAT